jgi:hypothetical protein
VHSVRRKHPGDGAQAQAEDHRAEHRAEQGNHGNLDREHLGPPGRGHLTMSAGYGG